MKLLHATLLITSGFLIIFINIQKLTQQRSDSSIDYFPHLLALSIEKDILSLSKEGLLPPEWDSVAEVKFFATNTITENWLRDANLKFPINKEGGYRLEGVLIVETPGDQKSRLLIQYGLYDLKSQNKIWEKIRIYSQ